MNATRNWEDSQIALFPLDVAACFNTITQESGINEVKTDDLGRWPEFCRLHCPPTSPTAKVQNGPWRCASKIMEGGGILVIETS